MRQFKVVPLDARTGQARPLKVDKETGLCVPVIKHACFDKHQTRLIVTAYDLSVQLWNINDGVNLMQLQPQLYSTTLAHVYANLPRGITSVSYEMVLAGGGEKKAPRKLILIGTEHGNVCGYHESNSVVDDVPVMFLRLSDQSKDLTALYAAGSGNPGGEQPAETKSNLKVLVKSLINKSTGQAGQVVANGNSKVPVVAAFTGSRNRHDYAVGNQAGSKGKRHSVLTGD